MNIKLLHFLLLFVLLSLIIRVKDDRVFVRVKGLWSGRGQWERKWRGDLVYAEGEWVG